MACFRKLNVLNLQQMVILPVGGGIMKRISEWWKKICGVMKTQSFFVILFVCIAALAVTAIYVTTYNRNRVSQKPLSDLYSLEGSMKKDENKADTNKTDRTNEDDQKAQEDVGKTTAQETSANAQPSTQTPDSQKTKSPSGIEPVMAQKKDVQAKATAWKKPVDGVPGNGFSTDKLVYSKTLDQWTTHNGMDIKSAFGDDVAAVTDGTIKKVYTDGKMGVTVDLDTGSGVTARYSNLDNSLEVEQGQSVKAGDVIGKIGNTALFEISDGDHLHFEVLNNGKYVNPAQYVKY